MKTLFLIFACFLTSVRASYSYSEQSKQEIDERTGRIRGFYNVEDSDFYLGGLLRVHADEEGVYCSNDFIERGVEETEAMLFAIDSVNNDPVLLPNITLGYDIRDYCGSENVAVDEVVDWALTSDVAEDLQECDQNDNATANSQKSFFAAVIGAFHSRASAPVASFLRPFEVPQVSYGSTSPTLSNRIRYSYFLRTIPPDTVQSRVVADIMLSQGWNVISAIHSNEVYGENGIDEFRFLAPRLKICLDLDEGINEDFTPDDYAELARKIYDSSTSVVLLFALEVYVQPLLEQVNQIRPRKHFVWIATDTWAESSSIQEEFGDMLVGMIGVAPFTPITEEFSDQYYSKITPSNNKRDPYFAEYCHSFLSRTASIACTNNTSIANVSGYSPGTFAPFIIQAVYSVAHGLHNFLSESCDAPVQWNRTSRSCKGQNFTTNGSVIFDYISRVDFATPGTGTRVAFGNDSGDPVVSEYKLVNFQRTSEGKNELVEIGMWDSVEGIVLDGQPIQFGLDEDNGGVLSTFESQCQVCQPGEIQEKFQASCCSLCVPCTDEEYANSSDSSECLPCGEGMWGNNPVNGSDGCVALEEIFVNYDNAWGIVIIIFAVIGLVCVAAVSAVIALFYWTNPVIKSFGREQLILILIGLALCFFFPFFYVFRPSLGLCLLRWFGFWFSLTLIFAALLIKLIRVMRVFLGGITGGRLLVKPWQQVVFTFLVVSGEIILVIISMVVDYPVANIEMSTNAEDIFPVIIITCNSVHPAMLVLLILYDSVLVILINGFAIFTIQFPKNFKEARNIAFATFAVGVVWIAFIPIYFATNNEYQSGSIALAMMCMAFSILGCLIVPRLYTAHINHERKSAITTVQSEDSLKNLKKLATNSETCKTQLESVIDGTV